MIYFSSFFCKVLCSILHNFPSLCFPYPFLFLFFLLLLILSLILLCYFFLFFYFFSRLSSVNNPPTLALNNTAFVFTSNAGLGQKDEISKIGNSKIGNSNIGNNGFSNTHGNSNTSTNTNSGKTLKNLPITANNSEASLFSRLNANNGIKRSSTMY